MYKKILVLLIIIIGISVPLLAAESQKIEMETTDIPYRLTADGWISYDNKQGVLVATNNAHFKSDNIMIVADEIAVFYEENVVRAVGEQMSIKVGEQVYKGTSLDFNYHTLTGSISGVSSKISDLSVSGKNITLKEGNDFEINEVELTPCVLPNPHYSIKAKRVTVYPEDRIVAKGVWFYFNGYRVFYLPVYTVKFNHSTGSFDRVSLATSLGYNSADGIFLGIEYPYELTERLSGNISAQLNQYGEKDFEMENRYSIYSNLEIINSYLYKEDEDDDGEIEETNELSGGLHYMNNGLDIYSFYKYEYVSEKNIIEFDMRYKHQKYDFKYFNKFIESELSNELYSIRYNNSSPIKLLYKKGYVIDYLPYLSIEDLKYNYSGIDINSSIGIGKVANKGISSDKARLDLGLNKNFVVNDKLNINLYGQFEGNYYISDDNGNSIEENHYNYYLLGFNTKMNNDINKKLTIDYGLGYNYSWQTGAAYLPEDKKEVKEIISPAVGISYRISKYDSIKFDIEASYELEDKKLEDLNVKLTRQFDCYSYYVGYDLVDESFELGINF